MKLTLLSIYTIIGFTAFSQVAVFNFNNGTANDAIGSNNGTVSGASLTTDRFGNSNSAYQFDGVDDIISVPDAFEFQFTSHYGISVWVYIEDINGQNLGPIVIKRNPAPPYNQYDLAVTDDIQFTGLGNTIQYLHKSDVNAASHVFVSSQLTVGWHHIVVTSDTTLNQIEMYYDNSLVQSIIYSNDMDKDCVISGKPFEIGGNADGSYFFKGKIDDVMIYHNFLSSADVEALFLAPDPINLGITDKELNIKTTVSPNPSQNTITISTEEKINEITILDATGKIIKTSNQTSFSVAELSNGIYFLSISTDKGTAQNKFIKE
jgi:hypothetical protein